MKSTNVVSLGKGAHEVAIEIKLLFNFAPDWHLPHPCCSLTSTLPPHFASPLLAVSQAPSSFIFFSFLLFLSVFLGLSVYFFHGVVATVFWGFVVVTVPRIEPQGSHMQNNTEFLSYNFPVLSPCYNSILLMEKEKEHNLQ